MAGRGRAGRSEPQRARTESVVVPFPRTASGDRLELGRLVPSSRSLVIAFAVLGGILLAVLAARETPLFGIRTIEVTGADAQVQRQVRRALDGRSGDSLFGVDLDAATVDVSSLSTVAAVSFDRAYPHTLRVTVVPERAVAIVRQGADSFVVSERGRVMGPAQRTDRPGLARIWVAKDVRLDPGAFVEGELRTAVGAVAPLAGIAFPSRVVSVGTTDELTLRLRSGLELLMGDMKDVDLKLAVAGRILPLLPRGTKYLDVSVPHRPVAGSTTLDSQVEPETSPSTGT